MFSTSRFVLIFIGSADRRQRKVNVTAGKGFCDRFKNKEYLSFNGVL
ncbi:hypothetical protein EDWATA_03878 [Edwardsiella tarda ATCC 23685]|uniref:Uncharacterized protein n=1 Tax=Edwardsiella tarda ATCC 23685 TaxID=500638 RepID=D4FAQ7_EDWTA|nr:hypothetical protein EDWATA_03878 [Edwardsiella tarda ATCC 23685]